MNNDWEERTGPLKLIWEYMDESGEFISPSVLYSVNLKTGEIQCSMWEDGNWSCDCNRAEMFGLTSKYPTHTFPCGDSISVISMEEVKVDSL